MKARIILLIVFIAVVAFKRVAHPVPYAFPRLTFFPKMPEAADNAVTIEGANLGRYLFYDPILSIDSNLSCASCHKQAAAFSDAPNTFSKGAGGVLLERNTLPLFNLAWSPTLFWDGRAGDIETQVFHPITAHNEMNITWPLAMERIQKSNFYKNKFRSAFGEQRIDSVLISKAIAQFERTLISHTSRYDQVLEGKVFFTKEEFAGYELINDMTRGNCLQCHPTDGDVLSTTFDFSNNGLDTASSGDLYKDKGRGKITGKASDNGKFKIPSLRNIALTAPYMHDGRFKTLEEVLNFYSNGVHSSVNIDTRVANAHNKGVRLTIDEKRKIIAFLQTLTDSAFISNPEFSDPFK